MELLDDEDDDELRIEERLLRALRRVWRISFTELLSKRRLTRLIVLFTCVRARVTAGRMRMVRRQRTFSRPRSLRQVSLRSCAVVLRRTRSAAARELLERLSWFRQITRSVPV